MFLLSNKVYSPQYGLWLLPWFALVLPRLRLFLAFAIADVAVFVTRFSWFGRLQGAPGASLDLFELDGAAARGGAGLVRGAWIRRDAETARDRDAPAPSMTAAAEPPAAVAPARG